MVDRILELLKKSGITAKKLTDELELSNSAVTDWKKRRAKPSTDAVIKIARYFNVSTDYILTGKEFTNNCTSKEYVNTFNKSEEILLSNFRKLNNNNKNIILNLLGTLLENNSTPNNNN